MILRSSKALSAAVGLLLLLAVAAGAQQPGTAVGTTLTGLVIDAQSGVGVAGAFVSLGERGPRAIADSLGFFRMTGVTSGLHTLRVQRFGYLEIAVEITVAAVEERIELRMEVDPVALSGLTVDGGTRVVLTGQVRDANTDEPLPWTSFWLSRDAVRETGGGSSDGNGVFHLDAVLTGPYFVRVERIGYESQLLPIEITAPPVPLEVRLRPDSALLAGIARFDSTRRNRRSASPYLVRAFGENELRLSQSRGMRQFLEQYTALFPCGDLDGSLCQMVRGRAANAVVFIDELFAYGGMKQLDTYQPGDLYSIEVFTCARSVIVRAYTYGFVERIGRRAQAMFPGCGVGGN